MDLREYLFKNRISKAAFARQIGLNNTYFCNLTNGKVLPSLTTAVMIMRATNGAVRPEEWIKEDSKEHKE